MTPEKLQEDKTQIVAFSLADEEYGVSITQVQEIIRPQEVTRIPGMPTFIEGVVNLRGKIIPIIDLRQRFGLAQKAIDTNTRVVVVEVTEQTVGLVVDSVNEVLWISNTAIDPLPPTITSIDAEYLKGVGKLERRLIILLELEKVLTDLEKVALEKMNKILPENIAGHQETETKKEESS